MWSKKMSPAASEEEEEDSAEVLTTTTVTRSRRLLVTEAEVAIALTRHCSRAWVSQSKSETLGNLGLRNENFCPGGLG